MKCPNCENWKSDVVSTRVANHGDTRRRRKCRQCGARWSTYEIAVVLDGEYDFGSGAGLREAFDELLLRRARVSFRTMVRSAMAPLNELIKGE